MIVHGLLSTCLMQRRGMRYFYFVSLESLSSLNIKKSHSCKCPASLILSIQENIEYDTDDREIGRTSAFLNAELHAQLRSITTRKLAYLTCDLMQQSVRG
ncbi:hypothetical protein OnM2_033075 [Erysiphe neolycopersici]|uniref:Uncharacterized protein n=1 Tax=Erysiphe neolycopersici TaxID=212602 RepID=A0A420HYD9_9PEZI|nr:hypothetical protein OnM2_033075 [Erysiphe neolycopersici]